MDNMNEIKKFMLEKIAENISLSDIQTMVNEKFNTKMTFMDIRILASELEVDWRSEEENKAEEKTAETEDNTEEKDSVQEKTTAKTTVELNKIVRPGAIASGSVNFASGVYAEWFIDNNGRLGLDKVKGGKPTEQDIEDFQVEMQKIFGEQ
ncbi:MAG: hypothetical protein IKA22_11840 [Lentisphaeria bacterium]|nr:hypothetical protein [Lentisphaeria bacterium]